MAGLAQRARAAARRRSPRRGRTARPQHGRDARAGSRGSAFPRRIAGLVLSATSPAFGRPTATGSSEFLAAAPRPARCGQDDGRSRAGAGRRASSARARIRRRPARDRGACRAVPGDTYRAALRAIVGFDRRGGTRCACRPGAGARGRARCDRAARGDGDDGADASPAPSTSCSRAAATSPTSSARARSTTPCSAGWDGVFRTDEEVPMYVPPPISGEGYPLSAPAARAARRRLAARAREVRAARRAVRP